jgi:hypothetical protein
MNILIRSLVLAGLCAGLLFAAGGAPGTGPGTGPATGSVGGAGTTSVPTSNGTTSATNPSSVGSSNTPPEQLGGGVGTGNVSKSTTHASSQTNEDYQNTVRLYGANSNQAKASLARQNARTQSPSRSGGGYITGQTYPANGTFTPDINSGSGAAGMANPVSAGAGMATGTGTGNAASTNGSPVAH